MQCKEQVDLLEALRKSRKEAKDKEKEKESENSLKSGSTMWGRPPVPKKIHNSTGQQSSPTWMGDGTVPPVNYPDYSRAPPPLPHRPAFPKLDSTSPTERSDSSSPFSMMPPPPTPPQPSQSPATLPVPLKKTSRTPSPEKKGRVMLTTLRGPKDGKKPSKSPRASAGRFTAPRPHRQKLQDLRGTQYPKLRGRSWDRPWEDEMAVPLQWTLFTVIVSVGTVLPGLILQQTAKIKL